MNGRVLVYGCACEAWLLVDEALKLGPVWQPPPGFAPRVAALRAAVPDVADGRRLRLAGVLRAAALGLIVSVAGYLAGRLLEPAASEMGRRLAHRSAAVAAQIAGSLASSGSEALAANASSLAWTCAALSLCAAAWFTRRAFA